MSTSELRRLGRHVAERQNVGLSDHLPGESARQKLAEYVGQRRPSVPRPRARAVAMLAFGATVGCAALAFLLRGESAPLSFHVGSQGDTGTLSGWVTAQAASVPIRFSDGTRFVLEPGAKARVIRVTPRGASLVLESGTASVDVVPNERGRWEVRTGPFVVEVHGTRFDLSWDPKADQFHLALHEGRVVVSGCTFGTGQPVEAGQEVCSSCEQRELAVKRIGAADDTKALVETEARVAHEPDPERTNTSSVQSGRQEPAAASPMPGARAERALAAPKAPVPEVISWPALAEQGRYAEAYDAAAAVGFEDQCNARSAREVLLLGDTARHAGHAERARFAYTTVRRRFAGTPQGAMAAFSLGRMAFDLARDYPTARRWLEIYLDEQPGGSLAQAALGRLLEAAARSGHDEAARGFAERYLARYPEGPHADEARKLVGVGGANGAR